VRHRWFEEARSMRRTSLINLHGVPQNYSETETGRWGPAIKVSEDLELILLLPLQRSDQEREWPGERHARDEASPGKINGLLEE
jgi:hypothetical protein